MLYFVRSSDYSARRSADVSPDPARAAGPRPGGGTSHPADPDRHGRGHPGPRRPSGRRRRAELRRHRAARHRLGAGHQGLLHLLRRTWRQRLGGRSPRGGHQDLPHVRPGHRHRRRPCEHRPAGLLVRRSGPTGHRLRRLTLVAGPRPHHRPGAASAGLEHRGRRTHGHRARRARRTRLHHQLPGDPDLGSDPDVQLPHQRLGRRPLACEGEALRRAPYGHMGSRALPPEYLARRASRGGRGPLHHLLLPLHPRLRLRRHRALRRLVRLLRLGERPRPGGLRGGVRLPSHRRGLRRRRVLQLPPSGFPPAPSATGSTSSSDSSPPGYAS